MKSNRNIMLIEEIYIPKFSKNATTDYLLNNIITTETLLRCVRNINFDPFLCGEDKNNIIHLLVLQQDYKKTRRVLTDMLCNYSKETMYGLLTSKNKKDQDPIELSNSMMNSMTNNKIMLLIQNTLSKLEIYGEPTYIPPQAKYNFNINKNLSISDQLVPKCTSNRGYAKALRIDEAQKGNVGKITNLHEIYNL